MIARKLQNGKAIKENCSCLKLSRTERAFPLIQIPRVAVLAFESLSNFGSFEVTRVIRSSTIEERCYHVGMTFDINLMCIFTYLAFV
ncbi:hypothetical protein L1987_36567 [Smallanthus sonchifolius]|uniref:Uncharacterized protein n=1 Tax=Smallanthus sonchifolius TaxID=185202 RepID=A0ACB9HDK1_9ASTR|nr:hypothetical protein L1987_36567 [Smallanthus sonchifolius]